MNRIVSFSLAFIMVLASCFLMNACGNEVAVPQDDTGEIESSGESEIESEIASSSASDENSLSEPSEVSENAILQTYEKLIFGDDNLTRPLLSENKIWVKTPDSYGVIDAEGKMLFSVPNAMIPQLLGVDGMVFVYPFNAGYTVIQALHGGSGSYHRWSEQDAGHFAIIDAAGQVSFKSHDENPDASYRVLGYGGGTFVVLRHISDFSQDLWNIYAIDQSGKLIGTEHSMSYETVSRYGGASDSLKEYTTDGYLNGTGFKYLENGLFYSASMGLIFNAKTDALYTTQSQTIPNTSLNRIERLSNGKFIVTASRYLAGGKENIKEIELSDFANGESFEKACASVFSGETEKYYYLGEGVCNYYKDDIGYLCDCNGTVTGQYPNVKMISHGSFINGYMLLTMEGADRKQYIGIIDKTGAFQYDPIE